MVTSIHTLNAAQMVHATWTLVLCQSTRCKDTAECSLHSPAVGVQSLLELNINDLGRVGELSISRVKCLRISKDE